MHMIRLDEQVRGYSEQPIPFAWLIASPIRLLPMAVSRRHSYTAAHFLPHVASGSDLSPFFPQTILTP